jgi:hypothetical protein
VKFAGGSGPAVLVGSGSAVTVLQGREAAAARRRREVVATPVTEHRGSQSSTCLTRPATASPRLAGGYALDRASNHAAATRRQPHAASGRAGSRAPVRELILFFFIRRAVHEAVSGAKLPAFRTF